MAYNQEKNAVVSFCGITKQFGKVVANNNITFDVYEGEILSLLGENGSGKTTLMNMLDGIYYPDKGEIRIKGEKANIQSPKDAFDYKIGMVHQHFKLVEVFTALQNIALILEKGQKYDLKKIRMEVNEICNKYGFEIDLDRKVYNMSVSEKQTLEIIKVLYRGADILILDEPTAVLTPQEIKRLFDILRKMREDGKSIIIITHKLNEVMEISDRVSILRKGEYVGVVNTSETNEKQLTEMMVGKKVDLKIECVKTNFDRPLLEIRGLCVNADDGSDAIKNVNFYIRGGEILGIAGITGCGQKELCEAIAGLRKVEEGLICHKGESIIGLPPKEIIEKGISMSFIPEDRLGMGLAPSMSVTDNVMLKNYNENIIFTADEEKLTSMPKWKAFIIRTWLSIKTFFAKPFVDRNKARNKASELIEKLGIVTPSTETAVRKLSGGNVQKVLVGREIDANPNVIVTAYPVRGLDINSSYQIYDILNEQKQKGTGILFVGEDLDVMLALCDKIMVLCHGKNMGIVHANKTTKEELGLMMTGTLDLTQEKKDKNLGLAKDSNLTEEEWETIRENQETKGGEGND